MNETNRKEEKKALRKENRTARTVLFGIVIVLVIGSIGGFIGYQNGIQLRLAEQNGQLMIAASGQYQLGLIDLENERFEMAKKRFEYVISLDAAFPGAEEKLTEALLGLALDTTVSPTAVIAALPTQTPIPEITPTVDTRPREEMYVDAQNYIEAGEWAAAIEKLDKLRLTYPEFNVTIVDGMYYYAYRNLGVKNIINDGNLEGGMYDLAIAERFGVLDWEADGYRTYARYFITGISFWEVDWSQSVYYFGLVANAYPNLHDGSNYTAAKRYYLALVSYGDQLFASKEFCFARDNFQLAYNLDSSDEELYNKLQKGIEKCDEHGNASEK
jgi:tetratricopeptide (TPR) repeat protein